VVTSPPYWGLRDYGVTGQLGLEPTPEAYVAVMVDVFREVRRVLRDGGTLWLNMGDTYASGEVGRNDDDPTNLARRAELYGTGTVKPGIHERQQRRVRTGLKSKDLVGIPWRLAFALQADGWFLRADIVWAKPNPMPESVTDRPTKAHEYVFLLAKRATYFFDADAVREPYERDGGSATYTAGGSTTNGVGSRSLHQMSAAGRNIRSVWTLATEPTPEAHFATFPTALASRCILAGSRMGDTVLDPFAGSGTVGAVAERLGRHSVLIELSPAYIRMAEERTAQRGLFAQGKIDGTV
jgi:DNA modification methylase